MWTILLEYINLTFLFVKKKTFLFEMTLLCQLFEFQVVLEKVLLWLLEREAPRFVSVLENVLKMWGHFFFTAHVR